MAVPTTITTSAAAISYIQSNPNLSVADITQLALQMDTKVAGTVKAVLLYSGGIGIDDVGGVLEATESWELAEHIGGTSPTTAKVATLGQTQAATLLTNDSYRDALGKSIAKQNGWATDDKRLDAEIDKILKGESLSDGTRTKMGLWDQKSVDFINSNVTDKTPIKSITPLAENKGSFTQAEVDAVLKSKAPSVDGLPKSDYDGIYNRSYADAKAGGLSDADAKVKASGNVRDTIKVKSFDGSTGIEYVRDPVTERITKVDPGNLFKDVPSGPVSSPIPDSTPGKGTVAKAMDGIINDNDFKSLANGADQIAKQKGFAGYEPDPVRQVSADVNGAPLAKAGVKALNALGVVGDITALVLAGVAAKKAWAADDKDAAVRIAGNELAGLVGGAVGAAAVAAVAAPVFAAVGMSAGIGLIAAAVAGGYAGDALARAGWDKALKALGDMGIIPKGGIQGLLDGYGDALDHPGPSQGGNGLLPDWLKPAGTGFGQVAKNTSPLVLDLDGDGVETSALGFGDGRSTTYFDIDNDGFAERTGWATGGDGLLALDKNGNGKIDNQGELFGNSATYADGFAALKALDSNADNKITSADSQWSKLRVWVDADKDGVTDAGELKTLADLKITQINLNATAQSNVFNNENPVTASSTFVMNGAMRTVSDVWFRNDQTDTRFLGDYTLNAKTLFLPTLKGFGNLKDLHVAMSGNAGLLTLVENFVKNWSPARLTNTASLDADVKAILFKWAGVESVSSTSRGEFVDGKVMAFMEKLTGEYFRGESTPVNPSSLQAEVAIKSFDLAFSALKTQLILQAGGQALFDQKPFYDYVSGDIIGGVLGSAGIATLKTQAAAASDKLGFWKNVTDFLLNVKDTSEFTAVEKSGLDAAIKATAGSSYSWESLISLVPSPLSIVVGGTEQSDYYVGGRSADSISGNGGDDILYGADGDDYLTGGSGNDVLVGGAGNDNLFGDTGNDTYEFNTGFGRDTIYEGGGTDTIKFGTGITASSLRFEKNGNDLHIYVGANDRIQLNQHFYDSENGTTSYDEVEKIVFSDGKTLDLKASLTFTGTAASEYIVGTAAADTIVGLGGDDNLNGGLGNDTYVLNTGFGKDTISDNGGTDVIKFGSGITASSLRFEKNGNDLIIYVGANDRITLWQHFYDLQNGTTSYDEVEKIVFSDGKTLDLKASLTFTGTAASEYIVGTAAADTIIGLGGDDNLNGGLGNDTYVLNTGFGKDTISDNGGTDVIKFGSGITASSLRFEKNGNDLIIYVGANDRITLWQHFYDLQNGTTSYDEVEKIVFSDGKTLDLKASLTFTGTAAADIVYGTTAADTIVGLGGDDYLSGGKGNDTYVFNTGFGKDYISDDGGTDTLKLESAFTTENISLADYNAYDTKLIATAGVHEITISNQRYAGGTNAIEFLQFQDGFKADLLTYKSWVWGATTAQTTNGTANADTILGRGGNDIINGNAGNDALHGGSGDDTIKGEDGNDTVHGGIGNDALYGDAGNDILYGDDGLDKLYGGAGADTFTFRKDTAFKNIDVIGDFKTAELDKINIANLLEGYNSATKAITDFVQITTSGTNSLLYVDKDGGANGFVQIATITGVTGLTDEAALKNSGLLIAA